MRAVQSVSLAMLASLALSADAAVVFSDDFDGPTTFWRARQNYDALGVHPPDVGVDPWQQNGVLRDGSDPGFPLPTAAGGTFYAQPGTPGYGGAPYLQGELTAAGRAATLNQVVSVNWEMYLDTASGALGNSFEFGSWDTGPLTSPRGFDLFFKHDGTLDVYTSSSGFVTAPAFSFATNQWVSAAMQIDYATGQASLTIGSQTTNFTVADLTGHQLGFLHFQDYTDGGNLGLIDNLNISVVPEPAGLSLIGAGSLGMLRRRGKR